MVHLLILASTSLEFQERYSCNVDFLRLRLSLHTTLRVHRGPGFAALPLQRKPQRLILTPQAVLCFGKVISSFLEDFIQLRSFKMYEMLSYMAALILFCLTRIEATSNSEL
jgi:hypothetical protein